jgi:hydroxymethylglutaryl-CoA synthase
MVRAPKIYRLNSFENIFEEGEIYAKTKIYTVSNLFEFSRKVTYINALIKINEKLVFGLVDEDEINIGEKVKAKVGWIGKTRDGLHIYSTIWEKKKEFSKPKAIERKEKREIRVDTKVGIEGYGVYIPRYRINVSNISKIWGKEARGIKSFPGKFDDQASYACNSTLQALKHSKIKGKEIKFIEVGSESKVYAVKPTASIVAGLLKAEDCLACDNEFACKAGTHAMINGFNFVKINKGYALAIGSDSAQGKPGDELELTVGDGACSFIIGEKEPIAIIEGYASYTTDTPDFWRNEGDKFPKHAARFSGEPAYYKHIINATKKLMEKLDLKVEDIDFVVFHQPNSKFPRVVGKKLGFKEEQIEPGIVFDFIGNTYSACSLLGLAKVLDVARAWQRILVVSYGSGAGSDAISLLTTSNIERKRANIERSVKSWLGEEDKENLIFGDYGLYLKNKGII